MRIGGVGNEGEKRGEQEDLNIRRNFMIVTKEWGGL